jgi:hypothetical protein
MTLARKNEDGSVSVGGVWCHTCGQDRYVNARTHRCDWCGEKSAYRPRGLIVKTLSKEDER